MSLPRRLAAEGLGTGFLLAAIVGSGILGERLADGNMAIALLVNALATAAALFTLIEWFAPVSGAHFNPVITAALTVRGDLSARTALAYVPAQMGGAVGGVALAELMFGEPVWSWSTRPRHGATQLLGEVVSTFGLVGVVWVCTRTRPTAVAGIVAAYIGGGFWFTPTDFANPAVTIARAATDTFSGIRPADVPGFVLAEVAGVIVAILVFGWLLPASPSTERPPRR
ncbi:aquaporin family protein [Nocardia panacis]|uniref:Aquaporin family protein n=1 Tax=Nocardia panacis TaxID=2340916 RepID=A0A3A4K5I9_9NOCA|nr:aquaporin family protein [Nocardia panacis]